MNELKPEDVMRALECCDRGSSANCDCDNCPYYRCDAPCKDKLHTDALALLREKDALVEDYRQELGRARVALNDANAEIERLTKDFLDYQADVKMEIADARAEAIDEFAERLKAHECLPEYPWDEPFVLAGCIDQIAKEIKEAKR